MAIKGLHAGTDDDHKVEDERSDAFSCEAEFHHEYTNIQVKPLSKLQRHACCLLLEHLLGEAVATTESLSPVKLQVCI